ncbi:MAG: CoA transferase [Rhodospirillales bacterium CG15_BIG_FIL_POST_REV_8_21_14_020_66_15]|nr:MAG: CoA transferase [Rhodospirillales bacterium CG15_BIG_FIL_POST_REV_8_21_14_020_66_15]
MTGAANEPPLAGIRVLELTHMLAGPYCGMLLADLGAEVIKVEPPTGDIGRQISPHFVGAHNAYFASLNRNKKSVVLDLFDDRDRSRFHDLVKGAHGLITNMRPSAIKKLGLTYGQLEDINPRIACLALTGYGLEGGFSDKPAYDYIIQALAGIMAMTGEPDGPPVKTGYSAVDNSAGIMGALGLMAKIVSGRGGQIDVSLYDTMVSQLNYVAGAYLNAGEEPRRRSGGAHPYIVPAQIFETRDGHLALFITHDGFWKKFSEEAGKPEWLTDARFATMAARTANRDAVIGAIGALLKTGDTAEWVARLDPLGIVVAGVETLSQALAGGLVRERGLVREIPVADATLKVVASPFKFSDFETAYNPPPLLGEHTGSFFG